MVATAGVVPLLFIPSLRQLSHLSWLGFVSTIVVMVRSCPIFCVGPLFLFICFILCLITLCPSPTVPYCRHNQVFSLQVAVMSATAIDPHRTAAPLQVRHR